MNSTLIAQFFRGFIHNTCLICKLRNLAVLGLVGILTACLGGGGGGSGGGSGASPTIASISPTSGTTSGGTAVTLTGTNLTGATSVTFGGAPGTALTVSSDTQLTVTTPAGTAGAKDVVVTTPGGAATTTGGYTYTSPSTIPTITTISPSSGTTSGGTVLTLVGTNFTGATSVTFGGAAGTALTVNSATQLTVTTPAGTAGAKDVVVTTPGGTATSTGGYTYTSSGNGASSGIITTIAGIGTAGYTGDLAVATSATLHNPTGMAVDSSGNLYFADTLNNAIRVICKTSGTYFNVAMTAGNIYTIAGTGTASYTGDGAAATSATLKNPVSVTFDSAGNLYIADSNNYRIRVIAKTTGTYFGVAMTANNIYTIVGTGVSGAPTNGVPVSGSAALTSSLKNPQYIAFDVTGNLYFTDMVNNSVYAICKTSGTYFGITMAANNIYSVAGTAGSAGNSGDSGVATAALLNHPYGIEIDSTGNLYLSDFTNKNIRVIAMTGGTIFGQTVTANDIYTVYTTTSSLTGIALDSTGNLYFSDPTAHKIFALAQTSGTYFGVSMSANSVATVAGTGTSGSTGDGGLATAATLMMPSGIAFDSNGNLYLSDNGTQKIREITP